jgi:hypothetical protein
MHRLDITSSAPLGTREYGAILYGPEGQVARLTVFSSLEQLISDAREQFPGEGTLTATLDGAPLMFDIDGKPIDPAL